MAFVVRDEAGAVYGAWDDRDRAERHIEELSQRFIRDYQVEELDSPLTHGNAVVTARGTLIDRADQEDTALAQVEEDEAPATAEPRTADPNDPDLDPNPAAKEGNAAAGRNPTEASGAASSNKNDGKGADKPK